MNGLPTPSQRHDTIATFALLRHSVKQANDLLECLGAGTTPRGDVATSTSVANVLATVEHNLELARSAIDRLRQST